MEVKKVAYRKKTGVPDPIDIYVGGRVKLRRTLLGISQENLADAVGLTFQQVQKYERGTNRMGASRLFDIATVLQVPISYFYEDMPDEIKTRKIDAPEGFDRKKTPTSEHGLYTKRETLELVRYYYTITNKKTREELLRLIESLSG